MTTKVFCWDEVGCEVAEFDVEIPDGSTARQALILADDHITEQTGSGGMSTFQKKVRHEGDVFVLDALFGHDKEARVYWTAEGSEQECRALAEKELASWLKENS